MSTTHCEACGQRIADPGTVGERIAYVRQYRGMSGADLQRATGISRSVLWKYETQDSEPGIANLLKVADALGTSLDYLARGTGPKVEYPNGSPADV